MMCGMIESFVAFTGQHCPGCGPVKEFLAKAKIAGKFLDIADSAASDAAIRFAVRSLPTVIFFDRDSKEIGRAHSVSDVREMLSVD